MKLLASLAVAAVCAAGFVATPPARAAAEPAKENGGLPLVFHEDFADGEKAKAKFEFLDPADWAVAKDGDRTVLSLATKPKAETAVRSPFGRAVVKGLYVGPFVLEVRLKSTVKDYGHRDLCLFFGDVDATHLYYVHLGKAPDPHCGNVFLVDNADRKALAPVPAKGIDWTEDYHTAKLVRGEDGAVEVFFDGTSWLKVTDKTFPVGRVGVGSFDDTGNFAEVTVWGKVAEKPADLPPPPAKAKPEKKGDAKAKDDGKPAGEKGATK